jgi:hypothetical protein
MPGVTEPLPPSLPIASFKLQFVERRVRIVPARDASGCAFAGPGVDLVLAEADDVLALARPLLAWLEAREPVRVRSLSLDVGRRRLLVTLAADAVGPAAEARPRVVKIDPGVDAASSDELVGLAAPLIRRLGEIVPSKLAARGQH